MRKLFIYTVALLLLVSCKRDVVDPALKVDFSYTVADNNYSVPVKISFLNDCANAKYYQWSFEGGDPATYSEKEPGYVIFNKAGSIKIKLKARNDRDSSEKEITILLDSVSKADFTTKAVTNNFGPTEFTVTNNSFGGPVQFNWLFEGGSPASSTQAQPGNVKFETAGKHRIFLEAINTRGRKDTLSKMVTVLPALSAAFDVVPNFEDEDYEAPFKATLLNKSISATQHGWSAPGAVISNPADSIPSFSCTAPGTYTISYQAGNGKQSASVTKTITVKPNSKLWTFSNVKLGINTAHSSIGSFFSTSLRKVFVKDSVTAQNGPAIDLVFFGLSASFNFSFFISPDSAQRWTFPAITGATHTLYINRQENCGCASSLTAAGFNNITNGDSFGGLEITETVAGSAAFNDNMLSRVVLFKNVAGRKGAVKITQFVSQGDNSYIICDIKVQKGTE